MGRTEKHAGIEKNTKQTTLMKKFNHILTATAAACILAAVPAANATLSFSAASNAGASVPSATYYAFDETGTPSASPLVYSDLTVTFVTDAQRITGELAGVAAAPFLSGNNNAGFGSPYTGDDNTPYLTSGKTLGVNNNPNGSVTLQFNSPKNYLGLLWGSTDTYNHLTFYSGEMQVGDLTGFDVNPPGNGNQNAGGTVYANIFSDVMFDKVVATSTGAYAFEFDNIAAAAVPEPSTIIAGALLLLPFGASAFRSLRRNKA